MTKIRDPIQGLRNKVRNFLRAGGVSGKFSTQVNRDKSILIIGDISDTSIKEYEGFELRYLPKQK
jgi:hypothetical protein